MQLSDALIKSLLRQGQIVILVPESYYDEEEEISTKPRRGWSIGATPSPSPG